MVDEEVSLSEGVHTYEKSPYGSESRQLWHKRLSFLSHRPRERVPTFHRDSGMMGFLTFFSAYAKPSSIETDTMMRAIM